LRDEADIDVGLGGRVFSWLFSRNQFLLTGASITVRRPFFHLGGRSEAQGAAHRTPPPMLVSAAITATIKAGQAGTGEVQAKITVV
jgi:hypothetical protein